jgi:hypothetical protein
VSEREGQPLPVDYRTSEPPLVPGGRFVLQLVMSVLALLLVGAMVAALIYLVVQSLFLNS